MSKLTPEEAISHCLEVAEEQSRFYSLCPLPCDGTKDCMSLKNGKDMGCVKCAADHRQLAEWLTELKESKRLLKAAVEDFAVYGALKDLSSEQRVQNPDWRRFNRVFDVLDHQWRYADEALKLLNDEKINNVE